MQAAFLEMHFRKCSIKNRLSFRYTKRNRVCQMRMGSVLFHMRNSRCGRRGFGIRQAGTECQLKGLSFLVEF